MLQEAMVKVKDAEARAEEIVRNAQIHGQELIENARIDAKQLMEDATESAKAGAAEALAEVKAQSETDKAQFASRLHQELEQSKQEALLRELEAVAAIIDGIL